MSAARAGAPPTACWRGMVPGRGARAASLLPWAGHSRLSTGFVANRKRRVQTRTHRRGGTSTHLLPLPTVTSRLRLAEGEDPRKPINLRRVAPPPATLKARLSRNAAVKQVRSVSVCRQDMVYIECQDILYTGQYEFFRSGVASEGSPEGDRRTPPRTSAPRCRSRGNTTGRVISLARSISRTYMCR